MTIPQSAAEHAPVPEATAGRDAPEHSGRRWPPGMTVLFGALCVVMGWIGGLHRSLNDNSFLWHLRTGHWILRHGIPRHDPFSSTFPGTHWVAQSWLAELVYAVLDNMLGANGIRLLDGLLGALVAFVAFRMTHRLQGDRVTTAFLTAAAVFVSCMLWVERPLFFGILAMIVLIYLVEIPESLPGRHPVLAVPVVMWLWVNVHGTFALGFCYLALHLAGRWLDGSVPWRGRELTLLKAGAVALVACLINPYGPALLTFPLELLSRGEILSQINEWKSPSLRTPLGIALALWIVIFVSVLALSKIRPTRRDVLVSLVFLVLGLWAARNIAVASLVGLPVVARLTRSSTVRPEQRTRINAAILVSLVLATALWTGKSVSEPAFDFQTYPVQAVKAIDKQGLLGRRMFTSDYWAGYLIDRYWPRQRVFIDDRYDMYPVRFAEEYGKVRAVEPGWQAVLDKYRTDVVMWPTDQPLVQAISLDPHWRQVYRDHLATVFVRR